jgi:capsular exopolysaccharide synthesis family protein
MERIQQALARARAQREQKNPEAPVPAKSGARTALRVVYSETRKVETAPTVLRDHRLIVDDWDGAEATAYKILRTHVLQRLKPNGWNALAVVSPNAGEGKTLTAANLAISLAREVSHTVLLVECDLRRPALQKMFGDESEIGLTDYLLGDVPLPRLLFNPGIERLVVLPAGKPIADSAELLSSPKMTHLVDELKRRYPSRLVLFDLPPLLATADALAFSPYVDAALVVIEDGKTRRDDVTRAVELLRHVNVLGTVLNKSNDRPAVY